VGRAGVVSRVGSVRCTVDEVEAWVDAVLARRLGVGSASNRAAMRACLVWSELRGGNHGLDKVVAMGEEGSVSLLREGGGGGEREPRVAREGVLAAEVDVEGCPGMAGLHLATQTALDKVVRGGAGVAVVRTRGRPAAGLEGTGAAGFYADLLADHGLVGVVACSCGPATVRPFGGAGPVFGTNPVAVGVPLSAAGDFGNLLLDMSTASVTLKDVRKARAAGGGAHVRDDVVGFDMDTGAPTRDVARVGDLAAFGPGPKASGLAVMVQLLAGRGGVAEGEEEEGLWGNTVVAVDPVRALLLDDNAGAGLPGAARVVEALHAVGALAPGERGGRRRQLALASGQVDVDASCLARLHDLLADN